MGVKGGRGRQSEADKERDGEVKKERKGRYERI